MNTKNEALELTQIDFGGDCDTPPEPWSAIWVAWNSEDGFTFWKNEKQASLWSAADSNEWPVQYAMQKAQPSPVQDLPFGVGGGLGAIKTLLSRDPCVHANTAIEMIDAILKEHPAAQPAPVPLTDENIDRIAYALTGFDGDGTQAMNIDEIRRIARAAARLTAAPEKGGAA